MGRSRRRGGLAGERRLRDRLWQARKVGATRAVRDSFGPNRGPWLAEVVSSKENTKKVEQHLHYATRCHAVLPRGRPFFFCFFLLSFRFAFPNLASLHLRFELDAGTTTLRRTPNAATRAARSSGPQSGTLTAGATPLAATSTTSSGGSTNGFG